MNQLYIYVYPHISSLLRLPPSHPPYPTPLGGHKAPSWSPCAMQAQHLFIHLFFFFLTLWRIPHSSSWKFSPLRIHSTLHLFLAPILQCGGSQPWLHIGITQAWEIPSLDPTPRDFDVMGWRAAWVTPMCNQGWEPRPARQRLPYMSSFNRLPLTPTVFPFSGPFLLHSGLRGWHVPALAKASAGESGQSLHS